MVGKHIKNHIENHRRGLLFSIEIYIENHRRGLFFFIETYVENHVENHRRELCLGRRVSRGPLPASSSARLWTEQHTRKQPWHASPRSTCCALLPRPTATPYCHPARTKLIRSEPHFANTACTGLNFEYTELNFEYTGWNFEHTRLKFEYTN